MNNSIPIEKKPAVLIVDDRPENLVALDAALAVLDIEIVSATSGKEALRRLLEQDFALIILDVQMPIMDGYETATLIRGRGKFSYMPIIFLTAELTTEPQIFKGYEAGAVDYLLKPVAPQILRSKVSTFVELYKKTQEVKDQARRLLQIDHLIELDKQKSKFVATVSHELRTPLAVIKGAVENVTDEIFGAITDPQRESLEIARTAIGHLNRIIENLLNLAQIESGVFLMRRERRDVRETVKHVARALEVLAGRQIRRLAVSLPPDPVESEIDPDRMIEVVTNLVANAIRFARNEVRVSVETRGNEAAITVDDDGPGIPEKMLDQIFNRFVQIPQHGKSGTGLGLSIVRGVVEEHGGRVWATNRSPEEGGGARFTVMLPLSTPVAGIGNAGILLVEDEIDLAKVVKARLERDGNRVRLAGSVKESLAAIAAEKPELLLLDIMLPDGSGMEILRAVRENPQTADLPVIALTSLSSNDNIEEGFVTGANAYLTKPCEPDRLLEVIQILRNERA